MPITIFSNNNAYWIGFSKAINVNLDTVAYIYVPSKDARQDMVRFLANNNLPAYTVLLEHPHRPRKGHDAIAPFFWKQNVHRVYSINEDGNLIPDTRWLYR